MKKCSNCDFYIKPKSELGNAFGLVGQCEKLKEDRQIAFVRKNWCCRQWKQRKIKGVKAI